MNMLFVLSILILTPHLSDFTVKNSGEPLTVEMTANPVDIGGEVRVNPASTVAFTAEAAGGVTCHGKYLYLWYKDGKPVGQMELAEVSRLEAATEGAYNVSVVDFADSKWTVKEVNQYLQDCSK